MYFVEIQDFGKVFSLRYKDNHLKYVHSIINESITYQINLQQLKSLVMVGYFVCRCNEN